MHAAIPFPDISPNLYAIELFGREFALRWYALAYIAGILAGWWLAHRALQRPALWPDDTPPMTVKQLEDFLTFIVLGIILGGRLGFVLFYQPEYYLSNPWEILQVWQGGMSFHGGLLGVLLGGWYFTVRHRLPKVSVADMVTQAVPPGLLLG